MTRMKYTSRELKAKETKKKLLEVAIDLIVQKGYDNVSINEICKESGVTKGAFYHHFNAKEDIISQLYYDVDDFFMVNVLKMMEGKTTREKLSIFIQQQIYCADSIGSDIVTQIYKHLTKGINSIIISKDRSFYKILCNIVSEGIEKKEIKVAMAEDEIVDYILCFSRGIIDDWHLHNGSYDLKEKTNKYLNIFLEGLFYR